MTLTRRMASYSVIVFALIAMTCSAQPPQTDSMDIIAESYVKLVLAVGQHDADYVDAYYGPPEWKADADGAKIPLAEIAAEAERLSARVGEPSDNDRGDALAGLRHEYLRRQIESLRTRVRMLSGDRLAFDDESRALYDAVAPTHPESDFASTLNELEQLLPGQGALIETL